MRFEQDFRNKTKDGKTPKKGKPGSLEAFEDFNNEPVGELLEKRSREAEEFERRKKERIKKLQELEEKGELHVTE